MLCYNLAALDETFLVGKLPEVFCSYANLDLNVVHVSFECGSGDGSPLDQWLSDHRDMDLIRPCKLVFSDYDLRGLPHTIKVERRGNELIVHIALTERPSWDRTGVILASEGWQDIGYGLKMQLTIASTNVVLQKERIKLIQKPGILNRLRGKKTPVLEDKS